MQAIVSRQNHFQNLLSITVFALILCYYAINDISKIDFYKSDFSTNLSEQNKTVELEKNICHLRAAILMDADDVQINGLMYAVENSLGMFVSREKAELAIENIYNKLLLNDRKNAVRLINQLSTSVLVQNQY